MVEKKVNQLEFWKVLGIGAIVAYVAVINTIAGGLIAGVVTGMFVLLNSIKTDSLMGILRTAGLGIVILVVSQVFIAIGLSNPYLWAMVLGVGYSLAMPRL